MIVYTVNLDYRCNERCVFCAADLGGEVPPDVRRPTLTLARIQDWLGEEPPGPDDRVNLSGGEPTLHRELLPITRLLSRECSNVTLFTNGLRLRDRSLVEALVDAGTRRFEISLFGHDAETHDGVTRRRGSHAWTIQALQHLTALKREADIEISVRLLVSRHTMARNPAIVRSVIAAGIEPSWFDINRAILSQDALAVEAPVSWADARSSVNETLREIRRLGSHVRFPTVPVCVFDEDTLVFARSEHGHHDEVPPDRVRHRYLDPLLTSPQDQPAPVTRAALPDVCLGCSELGACPRVDRGYLRLFASDGLHAMRSSRSSA